MKKYSILLFAALLVLLLPLTAGSALAQDPPTITGLVQASAADTGEFSTLLAALEATGLDEPLDQPGSYTVFAPTNEAFDALPNGLLDELLEDPEGPLTDILLYHVLGEVVFAEQIVGLNSATTLLGQDITIAVVDGEVILNGSVKVIATDIEASNGVVHVIDAVLVPEETPSADMTITELVQASAADTGEFSTLLAALEATGLDEPLDQPGTYTVFAPTNAAFDALPEGLLDELLADPEGLLTDILLYHVLGQVVFAEDVVKLDSATTLLGQDISIAVVDGKVILNGSVEVIATDIEASNGVVHVIDAVLVPEETPSADMTITELVEQAASGAEPEFTTLLAALQATGLDAALDDPKGTFTVFAPTDEAFDALPEGLLEELLEDPEGLLTDILLYHVLGEVKFAAEIVTLDSVTTLLGQDISIAVVDGKVILNGSVEVIATDIEASNGVVHVIDAVLVPQETPSADLTITELVEQAASGAEPEFTTLLAALQATGLDAALDDPKGTFTVFAPTDEAFDALPEGLLEELLEDPEGLLTDILLYHVLGEVKFAAEIVTLDSVTTLLGQDISIAVVDGKVILNGSVEVIATDIEATNGVVHVIDAVLVPGETPSAVDMASYELSASGGRVMVAWETATEFESAGFNLHRGASSEGPFVKVNADLIPAQGDEMFGGYYTFSDTPGRGIFHYQLEYVDLSGGSSWQDLGLIQTGPAIRGPVFRPDLPQ